MDRCERPGGPTAACAGDALIREARILAVFDVVEVMSSHRPYRAALGIETALEEILRGRGVGYDATVADACVVLFREGRFAFDEGGRNGSPGDG
jgi:HD-GYP domain-containing protein (c-di-GMP phosphodiesterase class II)